MTTENHRPSFGRPRLINLRAILAQIAMARASDVVEAPDFEQVAVQANMCSASRATMISSRQKPGEGIGLSIVKRLCELLDASLEMASSPETGTTFRVVLPRQY